MAQDITEVYDMLYLLGLKANHIGFFYTAYAVWLCAEQKERLLLVTKWLYPEVARHYKTSWYAVEENIRRAVGEVWEGNKAGLEKLAGYSMGKKPWPAQFLGILTESFLNNRAA